MTHTMILQFVLTILMYSIMGLVVGVGVVIVRKYPKLHEFINTRPVLGWTAAFAVGSVVLTVTMALFEATALLVIDTLMR